MKLTVPYSFTASDRYFGNEPEILDCTKFENQTPLFIEISYKSFLLEIQRRAK